MKKSYVLVSIVLTVLQIVFCLLDYFDVFRRMRMRRVSTKSLIDKFTSLTLAEYDGNVIASLYVDNNTDSRDLKNTINSIMDQTVRVERINVNMPDDCSFEVSEDVASVIYVYKIPSCSGMESTASGTELTGPKFAPEISRQRDGNVIILFFKNGIIYERDIVERAVGSCVEQKKTFMEEDCVATTPDFISVDENDNFTARIKN